MYRGLNWRLHARIVATILGYLFVITAISNPTTQWLTLTAIVFVTIVLTDEEVTP